MNVWAIVPVKSLDQAKSRLGEVLTSAERDELSREVLRHTLHVLAKTSEIEQSIVISTDPEVLALARDRGVHALPERQPPDLNRALRQATAVAEKGGATSVLVLPADLPLIQANDVATLIEQGRRSPVVAIAPDRHRKGTNGLLLAPPGTLKYAFGPDSFSRHVQAAKAAGLSVEIVDLPSLGLDLDAPEDLEIYRDRSALIKE